MAVICKEHTVRYGRPVSHFAARVGGPINGLR
jgi:tetrahydromethanopterin S-methyltransferase subunit E